MKPFIKLSMQLGECPRWNEQENCWYWIDIVGKRLFRCNETGTQHESQLLTFKPGCFFFTETNRIVIASDAGIFLLNEFGVEPVRLASPEQFNSSHRFNDGTATPDGRFIAGTLNEDTCTAGVSYLLSLNKNLSVSSQHLNRSYQIINGQAFSPCGEIYYVSDSPASAVWQYRYDATNGTLTEGKLFYQFIKDVEFPDGAAVDQQGNYWVALYGSGKIAVISPEGRKINEIELPVSQPTMLAFGGADLSELMITTAAQQLSKEDLIEQPDAGSLFILKTNSVGMRGSRIREKEIC